MEESICERDESERLREW